MAAPSRSRRPRGSAAAPSNTVRRVAELAWRGLHAEALALAAERLTDRRTPPGERIDLLDLRAESLIAAGDFEAAQAEADKLAEAAAASGDPRRLAQAANRAAIVLIRQDRLGDALATAERALDHARAAADVVQEATAQLRAADALMRLRVELSSA
jgi:tetratricopeptide (TPR) repeat protein